MFEVAVYLVVTLYSADKPHGQIVWKEEYPIIEPTSAARAAADDACDADARAWRKTALRTSRGNWMLDVACEIQHDEAEPAKGHE